jgi:hypothetical protein
MHLGLLLSAPQKLPMPTSSAAGTTSVPLVLKPKQYRPEEAPAKKKDPEEKKKDPEEKKKDPEEKKNAPRKKTAEEKRTK